MTEQTKTERYGDTDVPIFRPSLARRLLLYPVFLLIKIWAFTLRIQFEPGAFETTKSVQKPAIFLFWHNHIFLALIARKQFKRPYRMSAIASTSRDGAWPAAIFSMLGTTIIRGSAHTRGVRAAREMLAVHRSGQDLCLTPDGSRGPMYHLRPGPVFLSKQAESALLLFGATFHNAWRFKSWDRFYLPKPFSRIDLRVRKIEAAELLHFTELESARKFLEKRMMEITLDPETATPSTVRK